MSGRAIVALPDIFVNLSTGQNVDEKPINDPVNESRIVKNVSMRSEQDPQPDSDSDFEASLLTGKLRIGQGYREFIGPSLKWLVYAVCICLIILSVFFGLSFVWRMRQ